MLTCRIGGAWLPGNVDLYRFGMFGGVLFVGETVQDWIPQAEAASVGILVRGDRVELTFAPEAGSLCVVADCFPDPLSGQALVLRCMRGVA